MNIQKLIADKKKKFIARQGKIMINRLEQLERVKAERQQAERNEFVRQQLKEEKAQLRQIRLQKFRDVGFKIQRGLRRMNETTPDNDRKPKGIFKE